jgi:uncharacterized protein (TIGR02266 family)
MGVSAWNLDEEASDEISAETRGALRANVYLSVDVFSGHDFWTGLSLNMSEGGLFVATHNALPEPGSMVVLNINIPFEDEAVVTLAEVRWTRTSEEDGAPPGLGLQFVDLSQSSLEKIARFVTTVREPLSFEK